MNMIRLQFLSVLFLTSCCSVVHSNAIVQWLFGRLAIFQRIFGRPLFPQLSCTVAYYFFDFDGADEGRFPDYYHDDSFMLVAQTGQYEGVSGITEYVRFTDPEYSDFFLDSSAMNENVNVDFSFEGFDDGNCVYRFIVKTRAILNPATTTGVEYDAVLMGKQLFSLWEWYIPATYIYFPVKFLEFWYGAVTTEESSRQVVCDVLSGPCAAVIQPVEENCMGRLAELPVTTGDLRYVDGDSRGCRALHSILAKQNPELHCAHVSLNTTDLDPNEKLKCSVSQGLLPQDFFGDDDLSKFKSYCESEGIDPTLGYVLA